MLTKTITLIVKQENPDPLKVVGTVIEYRLFGLLLYKKIGYNGCYYGIVHCEYYLSI